MRIRYLSHLRFLGRLDRYVVAHFVGSYGTALFLVVGLYLVLDMANNAGQFLSSEDGQGSPSRGVIMRYYLMQVPFLFLQVAPFVTLLAGLFTVNRLLKKNEVTAVLAAGVSVRRLLLPIFLLGCVLSIGMFVLRETLVETLADQRDRLHWKLTEGDQPRVYSNVVVHDLRGSLVFLERFWPGESEDSAPRAQGVVAIVAEADDYVRLDAESATWNGEGWDLVAGQRQVLGNTAATEDVSTLSDFDMDPGLALTYRRARAEPLELSFAEVERLIRREPDDTAFRTLWHYHLTFPLANLILLLVGLPLLFHYERGQGSERLMVGGILCVFYFAADFVFRNLGINGGLSPLLAAWTPVLAFGSLGLALFEGLRS
jgi:lipopolysaccharide export LptBFGC system permease protein LptF